MANLKISLRKKGTSSFEGGDKLLPETDWGFILNKPATFVPDPHGHTISEITGLQSALNGKAASSHNHSIAQVTGLQLALDGKAESDHTHNISHVYGLQDALDGKADSGHTHTWAQVTSKPSWIGSSKPSYNLDEISDGSTYKRVTQSEKDGWNSKQNSLGFTPENVANKRNNIRTSGADNASYVSELGVKSYVDTVAETKQDALSYIPENAANKRSTIRTSGADNVSYVSELGVKTYVDGLIGSVYRPAGDWNAATNTPTLVNNTPANSGKVYRVSVAGTRFGFNFAVGDKLAFNENGVISKWDNIDDVVSVNGKTGTVLLNTDDIPQGSGLFVLQTEKNYWNDKQNALGFTPEDVANKRNNIRTSGATHTAYTSELGVKTYVDTVAATKQNSLGFTPENAANKRSTIRTSGADNVSYVSELGVKSYVDTVAETKQDALGFTPVPNTRTIAGLDLTTNRTRDAIIGVSANGYLRRTGTNAYDVRSVSNLKSDLSLNNVPNVDATNPANITQSANYRFVTDSEKDTWNGKQDALGFTAVPDTRTIAGLNLTANRTRDQIIGVSANGYIRRTGANTYDTRTVANLKSDLSLNNVPNVDATNPANISQTASYRFVTDSEKNAWNNKWKQIYAGTSAALSKTTTTSITVPSGVYAGKTVAIEIRYGSNSATTYTNRIVFVTLGTNTSTDSSKTLPRFISFSEFDGQYLKNISTKCYVNTTGTTSTIYFGHYKILIGSFSGTTIDWSTQSSDSLNIYIGKIWTVE